MRKRWVVSANFYIIADTADDAYSITERGVRAADDIGEVDQILIDDPELDDDEIPDEED